MATTGTVIQALLDGIRTSAGAAVASGKARFYQPGTLVAQTVYSDDACTAAITAPLTLDAGGRGVVYTKNPIRLVVKESTDTTTIVDSVIVTRAEQVYITNSYVNSGAETNLDSYLTTVGTSMGAAFQYKESSTATSRNYVNVIGEKCVSIEDFGAVGDGVTDDATAINAAIQRVKARGGGVVFIPAKTYLCSTVLTNDAAGVSIVGTGRGSILSFTSTSGNGLVINKGSSGDCKLVLRDFAISHATTSSGTAILVTNGDRVVISGVSVALFRTGIDASAVSDAKLVDCAVVSTDGNAASKGVLLGTRGRATDCDLVTLSTAGTGLTLGQDAVAQDVYASAWTTAVSITGARGRIVNASLTGTTGVDVTGANAVVSGCYFAGGTTGVTTSVAGTLVRDSHFATVTTGVILSSANTLRAKIIDNEFNACTTGVNNVVGAGRISGNFFQTCGVGIDIKSGAGTVASLMLRGNTFLACTTDYTTTAGSGGFTYFNRRDNNFSSNNNAAASSLGAIASSDFHFLKPTATSSASAAPTFTPTANADGQASFQVFKSTYVGTPAVTVANTTTSGLVSGQIMGIGIVNAATGALSLSTWGTQYKQCDGTASMVTTATITAANCFSAWFYWDTASWVCYQVGKSG